MSDAATHHTDRSGLIVVGPRDVARLARPLPSVGEMSVEGLTEDESDAFIAALEAR